LKQGNGRGTCCWIKYNILINLSVVLVINTLVCGVKLRYGLENSVLRRNQKIKYLALSGCLDTKFYTVIVTDYSYE